METTLSGRTWATNRDWEVHKELIGHLYCKLQKPLREVAAVLSTEHDFHATFKMYKSKFKKWGFRKNLSAAESLKIQCQTYTGQARLPIVYGQPLGSKRLKAWVQLEQRTYEILDGSTTHTIPRCIRPPPDTLLPESALYEVSRYSQINLEARRWDFSTSNNLTSETAAWGIKLAQTAMFIRDKNHDLGFQLLNECCAKFRSILQKQQSTLVWAILAVIIELDEGSEQVALAFIRFVTDMCSIAIGSQHPLTKLCCDMLSMIQLLGINQAKLSAISILMSQMGVFRDKTGEDNFFVAVTNIVMLQWLNGCGVVSDESCLEQSEAIFQKTHRNIADPEVYNRQLWMGLLFAGWLTWKKHQPKAEAVLRLVKESIQMSDMIPYDKGMVLPNYGMMDTSTSEQLVMAVPEKLQTNPASNIYYLAGYGVRRWLGHAGNPFKALGEVE